MDRRDHKLDVTDKINEIKRFMPEVYGVIRERGAYDLVRRGLRGEANCFYALEGGRVVGTPFTLAVQADVAANMVQWGCSYLCILPEARGARP